MSIVLDGVNLGPIQERVTEHPEDINMMNSSVTHPMGGPCLQQVTNLALAPNSPQLTPALLWNANAGILLVNRNCF
jgi:hypothetical protein